MQQLIKGSLKPIIVDGDVPINNQIQITQTEEIEAERHVEEVQNPEADFEVEFDDQFEESRYEPERPAVELLREIEALRERYIREGEELREHYRREGEEQAQSIKRKAEIELAKAREDADHIRSAADKERVEKLRAMDADAAKALAKAKQEGYDAGYSDGLQKGTDDGYVQGLKKCKETLLDLKNICAGVEKEKAALMAENRRAIFDMSMSIAEKITMTVFRQRDKQALEKMISEAAKEFRSAKSVRVSLSKLDLSEDIESDLRILERCFSDTVQVEFEVLDDAERGTLLVETDSEILDAGVSTQLRMIEELGRGKFRDKEPDVPDTEKSEEIGEAVRAERPKKIRKNERPRQPEVVETTKPREAEVVETAKPKQPEAAEAAKPREPEVVEAAMPKEPEVSEAAAAVPVEVEVEVTAGAAIQEQEAAEEQ